MSGISERRREKSSSSSASDPERFMAARTRAEQCCTGMSMYGSTSGGIADSRDELRGHTLGLEAGRESRHMLRANRLRDGDQKLRKRARAFDRLIEIRTLDTRVLADEHQLAHAPGNELASLREEEAAPLEA